MGVESLLAEKKGFEYLTDLACKFRSDADEIA